MLALAAADRNNHVRWHRLCSTKIHRPCPRPRVRPLRATKPGWRVGLAGPMPRQRLRQIGRSGVPRVVRLGCTAPQPRRHEHHDAVRGTDGASRIRCARVLHRARFINRPQHPPAIPGNPATRPYFVRTPGIAAGYTVLQGGGLAGLECPFQKCPMLESQRRTRVGSRYPNSGHIPTFNERRPPRTHRRATHRSA
jgi:hypothetical protein